MDQAAGPRLLVTLADVSNSALQTLWSPSVVGAFGSALELRTKVRRLLPGAPWPGLGAGGFRFVAASGDVSLLPSRCRRRSLVNLQVGPVLSLPAPSPRRHHCGPAARCWDPDPGSRPSAGYQEPISGHRQERCPARPSLLPRSPCWGGVASPDLSRHTWDPSAS